MAEGPRHVVSARDFSPAFIETILEQAAVLKREHANRLDPARDGVWNHIASSLAKRVVILLFYEPSTRTRFSFQSAALQLGGMVMDTENAEEFSSAVKGETLADTVRVLEGYGDLIVLRHRERGSAAEAAHVSGIPLINAGDGDGEHPTQALLDLFTIREQHGNRTLTITFVGDAKHGRTMHSLVHLCTLLRGTPHALASAVFFVAPEELQPPDDLLHNLRAANIACEWYKTFAPDIIRASDIVYMTRVQDERGGEADATGSAYALTPELAQHLKSNALILHPLPRREELPTDLDALPQARYFKQARNGLFVRMALLRWALGCRELTTPVND